jgi:hypothetical protein
MREPGSPAAVASHGTLSWAERAAARAALDRLARGRPPLVRAIDLVAAGLPVPSRLTSTLLRPPKQLERHMHGLAESVLRRAYDIAILGLDAPPPRRHYHALMAAVAASGAAGGAAGLAGFAPDAAMTTLAILRAVAGEARRHGEDLHDEASRHACIEIFLFGGPDWNRPPEPGQAPGMAYISARLLLRGRPLVALFNQAAGRYSTVLAQKFAAQSVPLLGGASGALLNTVFLSYYRRLANDHFLLRRLEREHGEAVLRTFLES